MAKIKILIISLILLVLTFSVQALQYKEGNMGMFLYYNDDTSADSMTINNGEGADITIYAFSVGSGLTISVDLIKESGDIVFISEVYKSYADFNEYWADYTIGQDIYGESGVHTIRLNVMGNSNSEGTLELILTVEEPTPVNNPPVITSTSVTEVNEETSYSYQVTATDADGNTLTYSLTENPDWLSISDGLISGTAPLVDSDTDYLITVDVSDGTDSVTQTFTLTVRDVPTPDTTPPTVDIIYPLNGNSVSGTEAITFTDNEETNPQCSINNVDWVACTSGTTTLNDLTGFSVLVDGAFTLYLSDTDASENTGTDSEAGIIKDTSVPDTTAPVVDITSPLSGNQVDGTGVITFTDNELTAPQCSIDNTNWVACTNGVTVLNDITGFTTLADEAFTLYLSDTDAAGNTGTDSESGIIKDTSALDTTPPVVEIIYPSDGRTYSSKRTYLTYTVSDANLNSCWYSLDNGQTNVSVTCGEDITGLTSSEGSNTWTIYTNDTFGNQESESVTFEVDEDKRAKKRIRYIETIPEEDELEEFISEKPIISLGKPAKVAKLSEVLSSVNLGLIALIILFIIGIIIVLIARRR